MDNISRKDRKSPSSNCQSTNYRAEQGGQYPILDGRHADRKNTVPLPIELFHPVFAAFVAESRNPDLAVPDDFVWEISAFMESVSQISTDESSRQETTCVHLQRLLDRSVIRLRHTSGPVLEHAVLFYRPESSVRQRWLSSRKHKNSDQETILLFKARLHTWHTGVIQAKRYVCICVVRESQGVC